MLTNRTCGPHRYLCVQRLQTVLDREVVQHNSSLAIVFVTSLFEFAYAAKDCNANGTCTEERAFAVAVGVISFFFCLFQLMFVRLGAPAGKFLVKFVPHTYSFGRSPDTVGGVYAGIVCAKPIGLILVILWSAGLGSNTSSNGPFQSPCEHANGFFASWLCWGFSVQYCYNSVFGPPPGRVSRYMYGDDDDSMLHQDEPGAYGSIGPGVE